MCESKKTGLILVSILLISSFSVLLASANESEQENFWTGSPKVISKNEKEASWWLKNHDKGVITQSYKKSADNLMNYINKNNMSSISNDFCQLFVNDRNNTIFIVSKNMDTKINLQYLEIMNLDDETTVKFIKGYRNHKELEKYKEIVKQQAQSLSEKGVNVRAVGISENGTIQIELDEISDNNKDIFVSQLKSKVPMGLVVLTESPELEETGQSDPNFPLIAGTEASGGTLGFKVSWDDGTKHGFLTAAHVVNDNELVSQPSGSNFVGLTIDRAEGPTSDSALIELGDNSNAVSMIYHNTSDVHVSQKVYYNMQYIGVTVIKTGHASATTSGTINFKGDLDHPSYGWIDDQVRSTARAINGDSGSPVYTMYWDSTDNCYYAHAYGILHTSTAGTGTPSWYSPIDGIETDLGESFDFSSEMWYGDWDYRKSITISSSRTVDTVDFAVPVKVFYGSGTDGTQSYASNTMAKVYTSGNCQSDFDDIRFTSQYGVYQLDYWMEEKVDSSYAIFWVNVPEINKTSEDSTKIFVYYGESAALYEGDGENTFNDGVLGLFDDFNDGSIDTSRWDDVSQASGQISEGSGVLQLNSNPGTNTRCRILSDDDFFGETMVRAKYRMTRWPSTCTSYPAALLQDNVNHKSGFITQWYPYGTDYFKLREKDEYGNKGVEDTWQTTPTANTWYDMEFILYDDSAEWYFDQVERLNINNIGDYTEPIPGGEQDIDCLYLRLQANAWGGSSGSITTQYDWIFVTKTYSDAPTISTIGSVETGP